MSQQAMRDALSAIKGLLRVHAEAARDGVPMTEVSNAERAARRAMGALQRELTDPKLSEQVKVDRRAPLPFADRRRK